jgi:predicted nucleic acid-binding protein
MGWQGRPYKCLELARSGEVEGVTCPELLEELAEKLQSKLQFTSEQAFDSVVDLLTFLRLVPITGQLKVVATDPDDDKTVECARIAGATHIVTGDRRHLLPMKNYHGIQIVTAAEFLTLVAAP